MNNKKYWWQFFNLGVVFICGLIMSSCLGANPPVWLAGPQHEVQVLVPKEYEGPVLIVWDVADGVAAQKKDNVWMYQLEADGSLMLNNKQPIGSIKWDFRYKNSVDTIPHSTCFETKGNENVVVCTGPTQFLYNYRDLRPNVSFIITKIGNQEYAIGAINHLIEKYFDKVARPIQKATSNP